MLANRSINVCKFSFQSLLTSFVLLKEYFAHRHDINIHKIFNQSSITLKIHYIFHFIYEKLSFEKKKQKKLTSTSHK